MVRFSWSSFRSFFFSSMRLSAQVICACWATVISAGLRAKMKSSPPTSGMTFSGNFGCSCLSLMVFSYVDEAPRGEWIAWRGLGLLLLLGLVYALLECVDGHAV